MTDPRMTPTNDAPVTVEQCDRERAWPFRGDCYKHSDFAAWMEGAYDGHRAILAFARHRLAALASAPAGDGVFQMGDCVEKISGSSWRGKVVGTYSTALTPEGYAVESDTEVGSVQIYPAKALRLARPRAAVGEQQVLDELIRQFGRDGMPLTQEIYAPVARAFLALQSPPAKVEG